MLLGPMADSAQFLSNSVTYAKVTLQPPSYLFYSWLIMADAEKQLETHYTSHNPIPFEYIQAANSRIKYKDVLFADDTLLFRTIAGCLQTWFNKVEIELRRSGTEMHRTKTKHRQNKG